MLCQKLKQNDYYQIQTHQGYRFSLQNIALDPQSNEASLYLIANDKNILICELSRNAGGTKMLNLNIEFGDRQKIILLTKGGCVHIIGAYKQTLSAKNIRQKKQDSKKQVNNPQKSQKMANEMQTKNKPIQKNTHSNITNEQTQKLTKKVENNEQQTQKQQEQPLRRSTRTRIVAKPPEPTNQKASRRQRQQLRNMASLFNVNEKQLDDDEDQSFGQNSNDMEDQQDSDQSSQQQEKKQKQCEQENQQQMIQIAKKGRKKRSQSTGNKQKQKLDDNSFTETSRSVDGSRQQQRVQNLHFSVPTKNPYS